MNVIAEAARRGFTLDERVVAGEGGFTDRLAATMTAGRASTLRVRR
jgi:hypothetical protein